MTEVLDKTTTRRKFMAGVAGLAGVIGLTKVFDLSAQPTEHQQKAANVLDKTIETTTYKVISDPNEKNEFVNVRKAPEVPIREGDGPLPLGKLKVEVTIEGIPWAGVDPNTPEDKKPRWNTWVAFWFDKSKRTVGFVAKKYLNELPKISKIYSR